ncbi:MAG: aspartate/glutamate racemase family protein [Oscillibacter sp.]|nr:aspartate/glutamate racemase family protein [Oscillibacter sp.]
MKGKWHIGLIRVVTQEDPALRELHGNRIMEYFPELEVESRCIPDQPEGIHSDELKDLAVPKILRLAESFHGKDALIVSCADDPGVPELQKLLSIPVVGAGSSTALLARRYGPRAGILGITDYAPSPYGSMFGEGLINLGRPQGVNSTLDLMTPEGRAAVENLALRLKDAGAQSIALACTGMSTIGVAGPLRRLTGLPVVDPVLAEGLCALYECLNTAYGK